MKVVITGTTQENKSEVMHQQEIPAMDVSTPVVRMWSADLPIVAPDKQRREDFDISPEEFVFRRDFGNVRDQIHFNYGVIPAGTMNEMHITDTVDHIVLLSGELWLILEDGSETHLTAGDCIVQNQTWHAWQNRTEKDALIVVTIVGVKQ